MGSFCGPLRLTIGFPRRRPGDSRVTQPGRQHIQCLGDLTPGQVGAQAVVHAAAEGQYRRRAFAGDVDAIGVVVDARIAVGRSGIDQHHRARREDVAVELGVLDHQAQGAARDRRVAHGLLDGVHGQVGIVSQQLPLLGMLAQHLHRSGHLVAGGVGARQQQTAGEHPQFGGVEAIPVVLGVDKVGDQIIGQVVPPLGDHVVDVVVEFTPRPHDAGLERFDVGGEAEGLEDVVGPRRKSLPILAAARRAARR